MSDLQNHAGRAHALLSASSSSRWLMCPPSAVAASLYPNTDTVFTREGTLAHEVAELYARGDSFANPQDPAWGEGGVTSEMIRCAEAYRDYIQEQIQSPDAVVLLEQRLDFSPWVPDGFGTGDCLIFQGRRLDVIDYKYGQGVEVSAVGNSQMRLYGLGAIHEFGDIYEIDEVVLHIFQPRKDNISVEALPAAELLAWGEAVIPVAAQAAKGEGRHVPGEHCRFCPHAGACPALASTCLAMCGETGVERPIPVPSLTPQEVADILSQEPMISAWLKAVKDRALASLLEGETIPGFKVVAGRATRGWADDLEVSGLLQAAGYSPTEYTKTEVLSPAAMEKALGKKKVAELLSGQILSNPGSPTVVPESDKRPVFDRLADAKNDFKN